MCFETMDLMSTEGKTPERRSTSTCTCTRRERTVKSTEKTTTKSSTVVSHEDSSSLATVLTNIMTTMRLDNECNQIYSAPLHKSTNFGSNLDCCVYMCIWHANRAVHVRTICTWPSLWFLYGWFPCTELDSISTVIIDRHPLGRGTRHRKNLFSSLRTIQYKQNCVETQTVQQKLSQYVITNFTCFKNQSALQVMWSSDHLRVTNLLHLKGANGYFFLILYNCHIIFYIFLSVSLQYVCFRKVWPITKAFAMV